MEVGEWQLLSIAQIRNLFRGVLCFLLLHSRVAAEIKSLRGQGQGAARIFDHVEDAQQQVFADGRVLVVLPRQDVREHFDAQCAGGNIGQPHPHAGGLNLGMAVE